MLIKIFSYNIHGLPFIADSWSEGVALMFSNSNYDFICLQEVFTKGRIDLLTASLNKNGYTVLKPDDSNNLFSSGLLTAVKTNIWSVVNTTFIEFGESSGIEKMANKGFHIIEIINKITHEELTVINTHLQSDNPTNYFSACVDTRPIRKAQAGQIYNFLKNITNKPHFIIGDLNSEIEPHEDFLYLTGSKNGLNKHTFPETGEDLDHVAIIPTFWNSLIKIGIQEIAVLTEINWSDHWPIVVVISL